MRTNDLVHGKRSSRLIPRCDSFGFRTSANFRLGIQTTFDFEEARVRAVE